MRAGDVLGPSAQVRADGVAEDDPVEPFVGEFLPHRGRHDGDVPGVVRDARLPLPAPSFTPQRRAELLGRIIERLERTPGVSHAAFTTVLPLETSGAMMAFTLPPPPGSSDPGAVQARFRVISPSYFRAMGIRLLEGRALGESDTAASQPVILVNRAFARQYLGDFTSVAGEARTFFWDMPVDDNTHWPHIWQSNRKCLGVIPSRSVNRR